MQYMAAISLRDLTEAMFILVMLNNMMRFLAIIRILLKTRKIFINVKAVLHSRFPFGRLALAR